MKVLMFLKRNPSYSRADFEAHYEDVHAPLTLRHMSGIVEYVRNYLPPEAPYDVLTEIFLADQAALDRLLALIERGEGPAEVVADAGQLFAADPDVKFAFVTQPVASAIDE